MVKIKCTLSSAHSSAADSEIVIGDAEMHKSIKDGACFLCSKFIISDK
jgi:hypothetical protein